MHATSILSILENPGAAIQDVVERLGKEPGPQPFDLAVVFVSPHHAETLGPLAQVLKETGLVTHILGVTGETIVGQDHEIENAPAISLWAIRFPQGVTVTPVRLEATRQGLTGWPPETLAQHPTNQILILLADPFSFPTDEWLASLNTETPVVDISLETTGWRWDQRSGKQEPLGFLLKDRFGSGRWLARDADQSATP